MLLTGTLPDVDAQVTPRQFAGIIVMQEISRVPGRRKIEQVTNLAGISRSTLYNVRDGLESVRPETLWALAAALGLPTHFFTYIIDGDTDRIRRLPGVREDLRQHVVETLESLVLPRDRRAEDKRKRTPRT